MSLDSGDYGQDNLVKAVHGKAKEQDALRGKETVKARMNEQDMNAVAGGLQPTNAVSGEPLTVQQRQEKKNRVLRQHLQYISNQMYYWAGEREKYAGYANALRDHYSEQLRGETPEITDEVREAIDAYKQAHPGFDFDVNNPDHTKRSLSWAEEKEAHAATEYESAKQHYIDYGGQKETLEQHTDKPTLNDDVDLFSGTSVSKNIDKEDNSGIKLGFNEGAVPVETESDNNPAPIPHRVPITYNM